MKTIQNKLRDRRGVALLIALAVLTAMLFMAVPFAAYMRMQHSAGTQALENARARSGQQGAINHARHVLARGASSQEPGTFPYDDPDVDTPWEFRAVLSTTVSGVATMPNGDLVIEVRSAVGFPNDGDDRTIDGYIRVDDEWMAYADIAGQDASSPRSGTLLVPDNMRGLFGTDRSTDPVEGSRVAFYAGNQLQALDIQDQQALINVNTATWLTLVNLFEETGVSNAQDKAQSILEGRYYRDVNNNGTYDAGTDEVGYFPYQSVNMIKRVADFSAEDYDRVRKYLTVQSAGENESAWGLSGSIQTDMAVTSAGARGARLVDLNDASNISPMATVRFCWQDASGNEQEAYRGVTAKNASGLQLENAFTPAETEMDLTGGAGALDTMLEFRGATPNTPCYVNVGADWFQYTGVDLDVSTPSLTLTGCSLADFDPDAVRNGHPPNRPVHGDVITWDHQTAPASPMTAELPEDFAPGDDVVIQVQNRHAVNINTATDPIILKCLLWGLADEDTLIDEDEAEQIVFNLLARMADETYTASTSPPQPPYSYFGGDEDWFNDRGELDSFIDQIQAAGADGNPDDDDQAGDSPDISTAEAALVNLALNPLHSGQWPRSVGGPVRFNSGDMVGISALALVDAASGLPVGQAPRNVATAVQRSYDISPPLQPIWVMVRTQKEFYDRITAGDSQYMATGVLSDRLLDPASPLTDEDREEFEDADDGVGTARPYRRDIGDSGPGLGPWDTALFGLWALDSNNYDLHLAGANGTADEDDDTEASVDNTATEAVTNVALSYSTGYGSAQGSRNVEADDIHATMQPFGISFELVAPASSSSRQLIAEIGDGRLPDEEDAANQASVYLQDNRIVLRISDQMYDDGVAYRGYVELTSDVQFEENTWHHVHVVASGTFEHEMGLFIDGEYDNGATWRYVYHNPSTQRELPGDVGEGYLWPVGYQSALGVYTVNGDHAMGAMTLALNDTTNLPDKGFLAIGGTLNTDLYEYETAGGNSVNVWYQAGGGNNGLQQIIGDGTQVTPLIPVVQTVLHEDGGGAEPSAGDEVAFWTHTESNGAFSAADDPTNSGTANRVLDDEPGSHFFSWNNYPDFKWLVIEQSTAPAAPVALTVANRAKVFNYGDYWSAPDSTNLLLAGTLPSGNFDGLYIGGASDGSNVFRGTLGNLHVQVLPTAQVRGSWNDNAEDNLGITDWQIDGNGAVARLDEMASPILDADGFALSWSGGYFLSRNDTGDVELHSYAVYDNTNHEFSGVRQVNADFTSPAAGLAGDHNGLTRITAIPMPTTRLTADVTADEDEDLYIVDDVAPPGAGYAIIGDEIIGYGDLQLSAQDYNGDGLDDYILDRAANANDVSAFPRGAFGTDGNISAHNTDDIVRFAPVLQPDRYRWTTHNQDGDYTESQLLNDMPVLEIDLGATSGQVKEVLWDFKEPLKDGQDVIVLVNLDGGNWSRVPNDADDQAAFTDYETDYPDKNTAEEAISEDDKLWGMRQEGSDTEDILSGSLPLYWRQTSGDNFSQPDVSASVKVRFYFDFGEADMGGLPPVELDTVGVKMVSKSGTF